MNFMMKLIYLLSLLLYLKTSPLYAFFYTCCETTECNDYKNINGNIELESSNYQISKAMQLCRNKNQDMLLSFSNHRCRSDSCMVIKTYHKVSDVGFEKYFGLSYANYLRGSNLFFENRSSQKYLLEQDPWRVEQVLNKVDAPLEFSKILDFIEVTQRQSPNSSSENVWNDFFHYKQLFYFALKETGKPDPTISEICKSLNDYKDKIGLNNLMGYFPKDGPVRHGPLLLSMLTTVGPLEHENLLKLISRYYALQLKYPNKFKTSISRLLSLNLHQGNPQELFYKIGNLINQGSYLNDDFFTDKTINDLHEKLDEKVGDINYRSLSEENLFRWTNNLLERDAQFSFQEWKLFENVKMIKPFHLWELGEGQLGGTFTRKNLLEMTTVLEKMTKEGINTEELMNNVSVKMLHPLSEMTPDDYVKGLILEGKILSGKRGFDLLLKSRPTKRFHDCPEFDHRGKFGPLRKQWGGQCWAYAASALVEEHFCIEAPKECGEGISPIDVSRNQWGFNCNTAIHGGMAQNGLFTAILGGACLEKYNRLDDEQIDEESGKGECLFCYLKSIYERAKPHMGCDSSPSSGTIEEGKMAELIENLSRVMETIRGKSSLYKFSIKQILKIFKTENSAEFLKEVLISPVCKLMRKPVTGVIPLEREFNFSKASKGQLSSLELEEKQQYLALNFIDQAEKGPARSVSLELCSGLLLGKSECDHHAVVANGMHWDTHKEKCMIHLRDSDSQNLDGWYPAIDVLKTTFRISSFVSDHF